jgi:hypothetical protein
MRGLPGAGGQAGDHSEEPPAARFEPAAFALEFPKEPSPVLRDPDRAEGAVRQAGDPAVPGENPPAEASGRGEDRKDPGVGSLPAILLDKSAQGLVQSADPNRKRPGQVDRFPRKGRKENRQKLGRCRRDRGLVESGRGMVFEKGDDRKD